MKKVLLSILAISAIAATKAQNIQGQDMENWHSMSVGFPAQQVTAPDHWFGSDSLLFSYAPFVGATNVKAQLTKSSNAHAGSFAARATTVDQGSQLGVIPGVLANAKLSIDIANFDPNDPVASMSYIGGTPINQRYNQISAWVMYQPKGSDNGQIIAQAVLSGQGVGGADSVVGMGDTVISSALSAYTNIQFPIVYDDPNVVPDKLLVLFMSSATATTPQDSSSIFVDDVEAKLVPVGVNTTVFNSASFKVYPNPTTFVLHLNTSYNNEVVWSAYNVAGQQVATQQFTNSATVDVASLSAGMYYYTVTDTKGNKLFNGKFSVSK